MQKIVVHGMGRRGCNGVNRHVGGLKLANSPHLCNASEMFPPTVLLEPMHKGSLLMIGPSV